MKPNYQLVVCGALGHVMYFRRDITFTTLAEAVRSWGVDYDDLLCAEVKSMSMGQVHNWSKVIGPGGLRVDVLVMVTEKFEWWWLDQ